MGNLNEHTFHCSGCFVCADSCPSDAISIAHNSEGFYGAHIDDALCTNCSLCNRMCPELNGGGASNPEPIDSVACFSKDPEIVEKSSSGGIFTELSKAMFDRGGSVYAACWDGINVMHKRLTAMGELTQARGSKYFQSDLSGIYKQVEVDLESGQEVLFTGLPCQVKACINYTENHRSLYTAEIICHGVPSEKVLNSHLQAEYGALPRRINFRGKQNGWLDFTTAYEYEERVYASSFAEDNWFMGFLKNVYLNRSCYSCNHNRLPRQADMSLGDCWGVDLVEPDFYKANGNRGISLVLINNEKGRELLKIIEKKLHHTPICLDQAKRFNPRIGNGKYDVQDLQRREAFFAHYTEHGLPVENYRDGRFRKMTRKALTSLYKCFLRLSKHRLETR